jgi:FkbM family methyltransferase
MLLLKTFLKKYCFFIYPFIRSILFAYYLKKRETVVSKMKENEVANFSFGFVTFPIALKKTNGFVDQEIFWKGCYEEEVLHTIQQHLTSDSVFVDIGANIGDHTLFASHVANKGKVISFEPIPDLCEQINTSVSLQHKHHAPITIHPFACGRESSSLTLSLPLDNIGGASLVRKGERTLSVQVVKADDILKEEDKVTMIKIDVEGFEYDALLGLQETISKHRPSLIIEFSPVIYKNNQEKDHSMDIVLFLKENNYYIEGIDERFPKTKDTVSLLEKHFDQINIFATPY